MITSTAFEICICKQHRSKIDIRTLNKRKLQLYIVLENCLDQETYRQLLESTYSLEVELAFFFSVMKKNKN